MYTIVTARCIDQAMQLTNMPKIAAGGLNETQLQFTFCSKWDGFAKTAVFYRANDPAPHRQLLVDDACLLPAEVCAEPGVVVFGVSGVSGDTRRTSEVMQLIIYPGTDAAEGTPGPTLDVYEQILAAYAETLTAAKDAAEAAKKVLTKDYVDKKYQSASVALLKSGWSNNRQTVTVTGVSADETQTDVMASPDPGDSENRAAYMDNDVYIIQQQDGAVVFACDSAPERDLTVNVAVIIKGETASKEAST